MKLQRNEADELVVQVQCTLRHYVCCVAAPRILYVSRDLAPATNDSVQGAVPLSGATSGCSAVELVCAQSQMWHACTVAGSKSVGVGRAGCYGCVMLSVKVSMVQC